MSTKEIQGKYERDSRIFRASTKVVQKYYGLT